MEKGQITQIVDDYHVRVRIPTLDKLQTAVGGTADSDLHQAIVVSSHGIVPKLNVGDTVLVDFETASASNPIVVGILFNAKSKDSKSDLNAVNITADNITVSKNATFPKNTAIGEVTSESIQHLKGLSSNIEESVKSINDELSAQKETHEEDIETLEEADEELEELIDALDLKLYNEEHVSGAKRYKGDIPALNHQLTTLQQSLYGDASVPSKGARPGDGFIRELQKLFGYKLSGPIILPKSTYGKTLPANAKVGQLYLMLMSELDK